MGFMVMTPYKFRKIIYDYYRANARDLPWRKTRDPYRIFVSELMLQQTQVESVIPKYERFIVAFPDFGALARAPLRKILALWKGLGYNRRALYLKRAAEIIACDYNGMLPRDVEELAKLPGIGQATASAIAAFAFNKPVVFIETNIRRVFIHHFFNYGFDNSFAGTGRSSRPARDADTILSAQKFPLSAENQAFCVCENCRQKNHRNHTYDYQFFSLEHDDYRCRQGNHPWPQREIDACEICRTKHRQQSLISDAEIFPLVEKMLDRKNPRRWYNALMDYGAMFGKQFPNPNRRSKHYVKQKPFEGSDREIRGKILEALLAKSQTEAALIASIGSTYGVDNSYAERVKKCLAELQKEGILRYAQDFFTIA